MKHAQYNGVCLLVIGKDGDWGNIPVAVAFVHKETADNFEWFFASCIVPGIKMHDRPLFSDRGKQRDAQVRLRLRDIHLHLKFCALHIFFNVCGHFRGVDSNIDGIRSLILSLQATTTFIEYETVLSEIRERFPAKRTIKANEKTVAQTAAEYLRMIHPSSWTKFGNDKLTPEKTVCAEWGATEDLAMAVRFLEDELRVLWRVKPGTSSSRRSRQSGFRSLRVVLRCRRGDNSRQKAESSILDESKTHGYAPRQGKVQQTNMACVSMHCSEKRRVRFPRR